jgi:hypothetical protein
MDVSETILTAPRRRQTRRHAEEVAERLDLTQPAIFVSNALSVDRSVLDTADVNHPAYTRHGRQTLALMTRTRLARTTRTQRRQLTRARRR